MTYLPRLGNHRLICCGSRRWHYYTCIRGGKLRRNSAIKEIHVRIVAHVYLVPRILHAKSSRKALTKEGGALRYLASDVSSFIFYGWGCSSSLKDVWGLSAAQIGVQDALTPVFFVAVHKFLKLGQRWGALIGPSRCITVKVQSRQLIAGPHSLLKRRLPERRRSLIGGLYYLLGQVVRLVAFIDQLRECFRLWSYLCLLALS